MQTGNSNENGDASRKPRDLIWDLRQDRWSDACGNEVSESQLVAVMDTMAPVLICPADAWELECPADTSAGARGLATATDNCSDAMIGSSDVSVPHQRLSDPASKKPDTGYR